MYGTAWAFAPVLLAAVLALLTRSPLLSLFAAVVFAAMLSADMDIANAFQYAEDLISSEAGRIGSMTLLCFLILLGMLGVVLLRAGIGEAYARFAAKRCQTRRGALLRSLLLLLTLYYDENLGSETMGGGMSGLTDRYQISRAKLAYIASQAAPFGLLVPLSALSVAVLAVLGADSRGYELFLRSIPYNFFGICSLGVVFGVTLFRFDFGAMGKHEAIARRGDVFGGTGNEYPESGQSRSDKRANLADLLLPALSLIPFCLFGVAFMGGYLRGTGFAASLSGGEITTGLLIGACVTLLANFLFLCGRGVLRPVDFGGAAVEGLRRMAEPLLLLFVAWLLSGLCVKGLGADVFMRHCYEAFEPGALLFPAMLFSLSALFALCTGTSWGTFSLWLPITASAFGLAAEDLPENLILCVSACLSGAVGGALLSPASVTARSVAAGAHCGLNGHRSTLRPYGITALLLSLAGYAIAGTLQSAALSLVCVLALLLGAMLILRAVFTKERTLFENDE